MKKTLVLYYSATGTTKKVAEEIAAKLDADIAAVHPQKPYTTADLNWHDDSSRTTFEQHEHGYRVEIKDDLPDISGYDNIIIGHPIWWAIPPRMFSAVIDHLDLNGKNVALFATSDITGYERAQSYMERAIKKNGDDVKLGQGAVLNSRQQLTDWLAKLSF